jgi:hypothetical protein
MSIFQISSFPARIGVVKTWHQYGAPDIPGDMRLRAETPPRSRETRLAP